MTVQPGPAMARVEGMARLRRTLKAAEADLNDLRKLHLEVAKLVVPMVRATAPVGPPEFGHIRSTVRAGASRQAAIIRVGNARFPYAHPIHWGWYRQHIKPNPWVSRAAQATEPQWFELFADGLMDILNKIEGA